MCESGALVVSILCTVPLSHTASLQDNGLLRATTQHYRPGSVSHVNHSVCVCVCVCDWDIEGERVSCTVPEHCRRFITSQMHSETPICLRNSLTSEFHPCKISPLACCVIRWLHESSIFRQLDCYSAFFGIQNTTNCICLYFRNCVMV